ncbi:MAG: hypothetical protein HYZ79_09880 [Candidatus Melainabacteria bacterium]|nr:hypothetical protein [Candidatus Melainabacteria bacterium]
MFILDAMPPVSGQTTPTNVSGVNQSKTKSDTTKTDNTPTNQGTDSVSINNLEQEITKLESEFQRETNPTKAMNLKSKIIDLKAMSLEQKVKDGTVTNKDIQDFFKDNPLNQPLTDRGLENYKKYSNIIVQAYDQTINQENTSPQIKRAKLNVIERVFKDGYEYRKAYVEQQAKEKIFSKDPDKALKDLANSA